MYIEYDSNDQTMHLRIAGANHRNANIVHLIQSHTQAYIEVVCDARHERAGEQREQHEREPDEDGDAQQPVEERDGHDEAERRAPQLPRQAQHLLDAAHVDRHEVHEASHARFALAHSQRLRTPDLLECLCLYGTVLY